LEREGDEALKGWPFEFAKQACSWLPGISDGPGSLEQSDY